jgi:predicted pyridoxine 5'-phosphate oxidase superfamily flavin-nucleotide-binding protein
MANGKVSIQSLDQRHCATHRLNHSWPPQEVHVPDTDRGYGFHEGELAVQRHVGVQREAARLGGMLEAATLGPGVATFLREQTFAALTGRDRNGRLWVSPLVGPPGFLQITAPTTLKAHTSISPSDPLHDPMPGQPVGLIVIDYSRRRRFRVNGTLSEVGPQLLTITVEEAFGNCPQNIPQRSIDLLPTTHSDADPPTSTPTSDSLTDADRATIRSADTFLLGTTHEDRGSDASHRGGPPGFVRVEGNTLWWPDYAGNNMFNSLGNLHANPEAALLFLDFADHTALHLSGVAELQSVPVGTPGDDGHTGRRISFTTSCRARSLLTAPRS